MSYLSAYSRRNFAGLGSDAKMDELKRGRLATQVAQGVPGASDALAQANAILPAQQAWDNAAAALRAAAEPGIKQLPVSAQKAARDALEKQIVSKLGKRPETPGIVVTSSGAPAPSSGSGSGPSFPNLSDLSSAGGGMALPAIGLLLVVGLVALKR